MSIIAKIIQILFKQNCLLCRQDSDETVCNYCSNDLIKSLNFSKETVQLDQDYEYYYLLKYSPEVKFLLKKLKFNKDLIVMSIFEKLIASWWSSFAKNHLSDVDSIVVVPIHRFRYLYRGFNQSEVFAQYISESCGISTTFDHCKRVKYTKAQAKSSKERRSSQLAGVFKLVKPLKANHLLVFDDVLTTGSTLKEFISTIKAASEIKKISVITLVRAG